MIHFILNNKLIHADEPPGMLLLDLIRYREHLTGTKIGCREGDCGACTILIGELKRGKMMYRPVTSCLTAIGNIHGKHVVTIEGVNREEGLNPLQQAICEEGGTQCGFCTPGFIMSMAGFCLSDKAPTELNALAAVDGNICRCTGYKSIERALSRVTALRAASYEMRAGSYKLQAASEEQGKEVDPIVLCVDEGVLPPYFKEIPRRLAALALEGNGVFKEKKGGKFLGGGTDLYVQQHEAMVHTDIDFLYNRKDMKGVVQEGDNCFIGGAATVTDLMESTIFRKAFPRFDHYARLISSTPIRNIATVAGNFVNASPIGDLSIFFLAVDAVLVLSDGMFSRELPLRQFFKGYKLLNKEPGEFIERIYFRMPGPDELFHFEKVSKRTHLDIASVNTAMWVRMKGRQVVEGSISAGGVGPVPGWLEGASGLMGGRRVDEELVLEVVARAQAEVSPISDVRGTEAYKRLLLGQLIKAHFLELFPDLSVDKILGA